MAKRPLELRSKWIDSTLAAGRLAAVGLPPTDGAGRCRRQSVLCPNGNHSWGAGDAQALVLAILLGLATIATIAFANDIHKNLDAQAILAQQQQIRADVEKRGGRFKTWMPKSVRSYSPGKEK